MPYAELADKLSVGVAELDDDHETLLALLGDLKQAVETEDANEALSRVLAGLTLYIGFHFAREEELLLRTKYPKYEAHRREHQAFASAVGEIHRDFQERASDALPRQVLEFLENWLFEHSLGADRAAAEYLLAHRAEFERPAVLAEQPHAA
jgi:hemerythrin